MKKKSLTLQFVAVLILLSFSILVVAVVALLLGASSWTEALVFGLWVVGIGIGVPMAVFLVMWAVAELFGS